MSSNQQVSNLVAGIQNNMRDGPQIQAPRSYNPPNVQQHIPQTPQNYPQALQNYPQAPQAPMVQSAPQAPQAPQAPMIQSVPQYPSNVQAVDDMMEIFGYKLQKNHVYLIGIVILGIALYFLWNWYNKKNDKNDEEEEEDDEMPPGMFPPHLMANPQFLEHMRRMGGAGMPPPQRTPSAESEKPTNDPQFDDQMEQAIQDL